MKVKWKEILCLIFIKIVLACCHHFSIVGSSVLRNNEPYKVAVTSHDNNSEDVDLKIGIQGVSNKGDPIKMFQNLTLSPGSMKILKFNFVNLSLGTYHLTAEAANFSQSVRLHVNPKKVSLLLQLDKPLYKPVDAVKYRTIAIDSRTKPYDVAYNKIWILDANNNELCMLENVSFTKGIYEGKFEIEELRPGMYTIIVEADETIASRNFEICEESQEVYEIKLSAPEKVSYRDGSLRVKISINFSSHFALRNFRSISGEITLTCDDIKVIKCQRIVTQTTFESFESIDFINDLGLEFLDDRRIFALGATFTDDVTKKNFSVTTRFSVEMSDYEIQTVNLPKSFKIGIPYSFTLLVAKVVGGYPVIESREPIYVAVRNDKNETLLDERLQLDEYSGSVKVQTPAISSGTKFLNIYAKYDKIQYFQQINKSISQSKESVVLTVLTLSPKIYDQVHFEVLTTIQSAPFAVFQLFSKGLLKISKIITLKDGYGNFSVASKSSYAPAAHCIAYLITQNGEFISDSVVLNFGNLLSNSVNLAINSKDAIYPSSKFNLNVTSTLYSTVSLLAIDQRGISQRYKHDISAVDIFGNELRKYDRVTSENFYNSDIPFWFYPMSFERLFHEAGAVVMTNLMLEIPCEKDVNLMDLYDKINHDVILPEVELNDEPKIHFDSFLFRTITVDNPVDNDGIKGDKLVIAELPEMSASWAITAITMHEKYGLGISENPLIIESFKKFYVDYSIPAAIKVGEIFIVEILIGNLYNQELSATVKVSRNKHQGFKISRPWTYGWIETEKEVTQNILIPALNVRRLLVEVTAELVGIYDFQVTAICTKRIEKKVTTISIKPVGLLKIITDKTFVSSYECELEIPKTLKCDINDEHFEDTVEVNAAVFGDIFGITLVNLEGFCQGLTGNAENILLKLAINVITMDYLASTDKLTASIEAKILYELTRNYEKLLSYRSFDGSLNLFHNYSATEHTIWLTANAYKYLKRASQYITVSHKILNKALTFIVSQQHQSGNFPIGPQNDVAFTASIGIILDEIIISHPQLTPIVQKAIKYVELNYDESDLYSLALVTHFRYEVDSPLKNQHLQSLLSYISSLDHFSKGDNVTSLDVEINSYCLMILDHIPEFYVEAFNIVQWLLSQQQPNGKFFSTRSTMIALEAISRFALKISDRKVNLDILLAPNDDDENFIQTEVTSLTKLEGLKFSLQPTTRELDVSAYGESFAIIQLSCSYYGYSMQISNQLKISAEFKQGSCDEFLVLSITLEVTFDKVSDLIQVSVESPSGYEHDSFDSALTSHFVSINKRNQGTLLNVYLKSISNLTQFSLTFLRKFVVFNMTNSIIEAYYLKNETIKTSIFYEIPKDLPSCRNETLFTSPPILDFTTLEPLGFNVTFDTEEGEIEELKTAGLDTEELKEEISEDLHETTSWIEDDESIYTKHYDNLDVNFHEKSLEADELVNEFSITDDVLDENKDEGSLQSKKASETDATVFLENSFYEGEIVEESMTSKDYQISTESSTKEITESDYESTTVLTVTKKLKDKKFNAKKYKSKLKIPMPSAKTEMNS